MAISPAGVVGFVLQGRDADPRFAYVDTGGRIVAQFARTGDGPGEIRAAAGLWFDGDTLGAFDLMGMRVERYDGAGQPVGRIQLRGAAMPVGMQEGRLVVVAFDSAGPRLEGLEHDGEPSALIERDDPVADSLILLPFRATGGEGRITLPAAAVSGPTVIFADAWTYRVAWARQGRTVARFGAGSSPRLPTEAEIAEQRAGMEGWRGPSGQRMSPAVIDRQLQHFATTALAQFDRRSGYGMGVDGAGRLWIPRELPDSVAWDVLAPGRLLGTLTLPCGGGRNRGRSVNGVFVAMECEGAQDSVPMVRVWRIE